MAYTQYDYSEIFCTAVENIVKGEISTLAFDISKECTIVEVTDKSHAKYKVSDGSITFYATGTEGSNYEKGDKVIVTIPQGDNIK
jgi:ABC-type phosphate transport system ATPase subunit